MSSKILVVDDAVFMRNILKDYLESNGYEVVAEACNGAEAVHLYRQYLPDLVTMDLSLPVVNGLEALKEIKQFDPDARIVICSTLGQKNMIIQAIEAGAKDFMIKPILQDRLIERIEAILA
ncbi:response regulator [Cohnella thailandensis]|uniref:Response regulator n=1 Tax=Cohnella thailandensis TaxID=557557 RepID=A0A841STR8_9BACL|nr:response regulator [Cohnella thailandensis]MBB6634399.1 response regulator [Cohnella thailandensis]MBP1972101.1 two-component system chemotaxis response regulator CheY [Cohnella thailandensis]